MPQDVFPETKLNISRALQISDCFVTEGSNVIMALCQPWGRRAKAPAWEAHSIKPPECQRVLLLETKQTDTNFSYGSVEKCRLRVFHFS